MKGRNGTTSFLPLRGQGGFQRNVSNQCLTYEQANRLYDKIEKGERVNIRKVNQHKYSTPQKQDMYSNDVNQYEKALLSGKSMKRKSNSQIEQWLILSDNIVYVRSADRDIMNGIDIKPIYYREHKRIYRKMGKEEGKKLEMDFGESLEIMKSRYMNVYDDVCAEVIMTSRFDENVDLSTMYLGRKDMKREKVMKTEESLPILEQGFIIGKLMNGEECKILLDTGVSKSYMSKSYYLK